MADDLPLYEDIYPSDLVDGASFISFSIFESTPEDIMGYIQSEIPSAKLVHLKRGKNVLFWICFVLVDSNKMDYEATTMIYQKFKKSLPHGWLANPYHTSGDFLGWDMPGGRNACLMMGQPKFSTTIIGVKKRKIPFIHKLFPCCCHIKINII